MSKGIESTHVEKSKIQINVPDLLHFFQFGVYTNLHHPTVHVFGNNDACAAWVFCNMGVYIITK